MDWEGLLEGASKTNHIKPQLTPERPLEFTFILCDITICVPHQQRPHVNNRHTVHVM